MYVSVDQLESQNSMLTSQTNLPKFRTTQFRMSEEPTPNHEVGDHLISRIRSPCTCSSPALTSAGAGTDEDEARVKHRSKGGLITFAQTTF